MKVCLIQADLSWQNRQANLEMLQRAIDAAADQPDLIVLPEMFTTGFTMEPERFAEPAEGPGFRWMQKTAAKTQAVLCGSLSVADRQKFFNRLYWVRPDGTFSQYDKRHLFRMGNEPDHYTAGNARVITALAGWNILPLVCYDLRFPVWSRCRIRNAQNDTPEYEYDLLIYVANWPAVRSYAWKQLLIARAIENQCYVIGVNRCGADGNGVAHGGESLVIGPIGEILLSCDSTPQSRCITLDKQKLDDFRKRFPAGLDADTFEITN